MLSLFTVTQINGSNFVRYIVMMFNEFIVFLSNTQRAAAFKSFTKGLERAILRVPWLHSIYFDSALSPPKHNTFCFFTSRPPRQPSMQLFPSSAAEKNDVDSFDQYCSVADSGQFPFQYCSVEKTSSNSSLPQICPTRYVEFQEYWSLERLTLQKTSLEFLQVKKHS